MTFKVVLNKEFGGFHLSKEMVDWLVENEFWELSSFDNVSQDWYYLKNYDSNDSFDFRSDPGLIRCVEALQEKHKNLSYGERNSVKVFDLEVEEINIEFEIYDHHDGKEKVFAHVQQAY